MVLLKNLLFSIVLSFGIVNTGIVQAADSEGASLSNRMAGLKSLSGEFEQYQYAEDGSLLASQQGNFQIVIPGKVRWETLEPMPQVLISNGNRYWLHDPDLEQVTTGNLDDSLQMAPAILFSGDIERLRKDYQISQVQDGLFQLKPTTENPLFEYLELAFDKKRLQAFYMFDHMGQRTEFLLSETLQNPEISDNTFSFEIPPGSDVINQ